MQAIKERKGELSRQRTKMVKHLIACISDFLVTKVHNVKAEITIHAARQANQAFCIHPLYPSLS